MTDDEIDEIEKRANIATLGPFEYDAGLQEIFDSNGHTIADIIVGTHADGKFFANSRKDVPALVAEVRRLKAENTRLQSIVVDAKCCGYVDPMEDE